MPRLATNLLTLALAAFVAIAMAASVLGMAGSTT